MARTRRPQDTESDNVVNDERRKELEKAEELLSEARQILEDAMRDEDESLANIPENIRDSRTENDQVVAMETGIAHMDDAIGEIESAEANVDLAKTESYAKKGVAE